ncbi:MAG TPA: hypothetical protein PKC28_14230 [Bdellovibrionales bacterium]|nr:hypothetical protein [Bdellovibrionales bacterium]
MFYGPVTMGVGYRHNAVEIKSVSTEEETGFQKSVYSGWNTFLYGNISMDFLKRYRGAVEAQYQRGDLGSGPAGANTVGFTEISISLRAYLLFD